MMRSARLQVKEALKASAAELLATTLGRRNFARVARFLWMQSRLDGGHDIGTNGERTLQSAWGRRFANAAKLTVFDVGANLGVWTSSFGQILTKNSSAALDFHLFEPAPETFSFLQQNARSFAVAVTLNSTALGAMDGGARLSVFAPGDGIHTLSPMPGDHPRGAVDVPLIRLDTYAKDNGISKIDILKIDTEGNDMNVLEGARELLQARRIAYIQFEYNHRWIPFRRYLKDAFDLLLPLGYRIGKITPKGVELYDGWHPELESFRESNYLAWQGAFDLETATLPWWNS